MSKFRDAQDEFIANEALKLFLDNSISDVTISMIAKEVGVGEATLYRHFKTKQNIVLKSTIILSEKVMNENFRISGSTGFEELTKFYNNYLDIYKNHVEYYSFINEFDAFIVTEGINMDLYDNELLNFKSVFLSSYNKGIADGTVNPVENIDVFYYSTTHALLNLAKKLAQASIVKSDEKVEHVEELSELVNIILFRLRGNK